MPGRQTVWGLTARTLTCSEPPWVQLSEDYKPSLDEQRPETALGTQEHHDPAKLKTETVELPFCHLNCSVEAQQVIHQHQMEDNAD